MGTPTQEVVESARKYLAAEGEEERAGLCERLDGYEGDFGEVVRAVKPSPPPAAETGWMFDRLFTSPRLKGKHPEQAFMLYVPPDYDPSRPLGLLIWLHGGGQGRGPLGRGFHERGSARNEAFEQSGRIVCYPSAPPNERCWARWQLPETDEYIADLTEEIGFHYALDPDDMVLGGHSMGGMGTLHLAHRFADRFASFFAAAAHWDFACWRALAGTTLWICHAVNDAVLFRRRHGTDIEFARLARRRLEESGVDFVYREHLGCHNTADGIWILREWLDWCRGRRRDPFCPHVVAVSPRGLSPWSDWHRHKVPLAAYENHTDFHSISEAPHARWATIEGIGDESVIFDMVTMSPVRDEVEDDWNGFSLDLKRKHVPAAALEARINPDGSIDVTPRNATAFTLWLHPKMVNLDDVRIRVRGTERFRGPLRPSLATLMDSYLRRRDWGMLYPAKVTIEDDGSWASSNQLKIG